MQNNLDIILQQISKGQILTTEQVDKFLTLVLTSLSAQKKELEKESEDRLSEMKEVMKYIEKEHKDILNEWESKLDAKTTEVYNKVKTGFNTEIEKAKEIIKDLRSIKLQDGYTPVKGVDYFDGKDADETKIVNKVLKKLPKSKDYSAVGIKDMLETLEDDDRLDYGVLKNTPDLSQLNNPIMAGAGGRLLSQMNDVDVSGVTDNSVLIWDEERSIWKIGTTSAGSGTVTSVSVTTANGISGTVANPTTTPAISLDISGLDASKIGAGTVSNTEFGYLDGVTSGIQTQLNGKQATLTNPVTGTGTNNEIAAFNSTGSTITSLSTATYPSLTELSYVKGVTSAIQTQLNAKGTGTVTSVSSANGALSVATGTTTPVLTVNSAPILTTARTIGTITGDATSAGSSFDGSANNTNALTLATVNSNVGTFGSATQASQVTVNAKGLVTAASNVTVTPAVGSITGLGTGVGTALAVNVGTAGSPVINGGALGTPSSGTVTNLTGTASININGTVGATTPTTGSFTTVTTSGNIELGNASDTTLSRSSAGVLAVEGVVVDTISAANTLTNKTLTTPVINGATLNGDLQTDGLPNSDDTWNGKSTNSFNAGATVAQFDCVYMSSSSTWLLTDADAIGTAGNVLIMMAGAAGTNGNPLRVIEPGSWVRNDAWNWTVGGVLYLDTATPGGITQTAPSGEDDAVKIVGHAVTADVIYFNPSVNWIIYAT